MGHKPVPDEQHEHGRCCREDDRSGTLEPRGRADTNDVATNAPANCELRFGGASSASSANFGEDSERGNF